MRIEELIEKLERLADEWGRDAEVRLAIQPSWPFEYSIGRIVGCDASDPATNDEDWQFLSEEERASLRAQSEPEVVIYISESRQLDYLPPAASQALDW